MIRRVLSYVILALIGLTINAAFLHGLYPAAPVPDIIAVLVLVLALRAPHVGGLIGAFMLGLLADFASARFLGPNAAGAVLAFCVVRFISEKVYVEKLAAGALLAVVATLAKSMGQLLLTALYVQISLFEWTVARTILLEALCSGVVAPIILLIVSFSPRSKRQYSGARSYSAVAYKRS